MADEINKIPQEGKNAGCFSLWLSFLIPLIGIILYYARKKSYNDSSVYLKIALGGGCYQFSNYCI